VFIAPGNHDPCSGTSPYWNPALLKARGFAWPAHVHVFGTPEWTAAPLPGRRGRARVGALLHPGCGLGRAPARARGAGRAGRAPREGVNVGVFHGSREASCPRDGRDRALLRRRGAGLALRLPRGGHIHTPSSLEEAAAGGGAGSVRLACAGGAISLDVSETGQHGALEVRLSTGDGPPRVETEFIELDRRRVYDLTVEVTGPARPSRWTAGCCGRWTRRAPTTPTSRRAPRGRLTRGCATPRPGRSCGRGPSTCASTRAPAPDHDLEALRSVEPVTTEDRFARALLARLDAETDPARRADLESALYYGLDAFRLHEVVPAYEELGE